MDPNQALLQDQSLLNRTAGAILLGCVFSALLYGITNMQVYIYYKNYPKDARFQRIIVGVLWIMDTLNMVFTVIAIYYYMVTHFGDVLNFNNIFWPLKVQISVNAIIAMTVQVLYALRVWKLSQMSTQSGYQPLINRVLSLGVAVLTGVGCGFALMLIIKITQADRFDQFADVEWVVFMPFLALTVIDLAIAGSMCWYLSRSRSSFQRTNSIILNIMRMCLVCGFLTSACSIALITVYATIATQLIFLGLEFVLTRLYVLSYVSMLTARQASNYGGSASGGSYSASPMNSPNVININTSIGDQWEAEKDSIQLSPVSETRRTQANVYHGAEVGNWFPYGDKRSMDRDLKYPARF